MLRAELQAIADQANDQAALLRLAETLTAFLARLHGAADTLSIMERQRIVRLVVKDVLIGDDAITIRHSIPVLPGPPQGSLPPSQTAGPNYLLCKGSGRCALRKVRSRIQPASFASANRIDIRGNLVPDIPRGSVGANTAEQVGDGLGIAKSAKNRLNPRAPEGRKEISQIHPQDNLLTHVRRDECFDRAPLDEPVHCGMRRNLRKNPCENLSLQVLQPRFWRLNQPNGAKPFGQNAVMIVSQARAIFLVCECPEISKPPQFAHIEAEPICQVTNGLDGRNLPMCRPQQPAASAETRLASY